MPSPAGTVRRSARRARSGARSSPCPRRPVVSRATHLVRQRGRADSRGGRSSRRAPGMSSVAARRTDAQEGAVAAHAHGDGRAGRGRRRPAPRRRPASAHPVGSAELEDPGRVALHGEPGGRVRAASASASGRSGWTRKVTVAIGASRSAQPARARPASGAPPPPTRRCGAAAVDLPHPSYPAAHPGGHAAGTRHCRPEPVSGGRHRPHDAGSGVTEVRTSPLERAAATPRGPARRPCPGPTTARPASNWGLTRRTKSAPWRRDGPASRHDRCAAR